MSEPFMTKTSLAMAIHTATMAEDGARDDGDAGRR